MSWFLLVVAGFFEIGFTTCLKQSNNFKHLGWSAGFFICIFLSFYFLNKAIATIPIGTAYAVWTGIGAAGTALVGIFVFGESQALLRFFFLFTLIASIVGLKLFSTG